MKAAFVCVAFSLLIGGVVPIGMLMFALEVGISLDWETARQLSVFCFVVLLYVEKFMEG